MKNGKPLLKNGITDSLKESIAKFGENMDNMREQTKEVNNDWWNPYGWVEVTESDSNKEEIPEGKWVNLKSRLIKKNEEDYFEPDPDIEEI